MYPIYTIPPVAGISKQVGSFPPQPLQSGAADLCSEDDAKIILKIFTDLGLPAKLINSATDASLGYKYINVDPSSPNQPWSIAGIPSPGLAGLAVAIQWGSNPINGGGIGNPGKWTGVLDGNPKYIPTPPPPPPLVPANPPSTGDASVFYTTLSGGIDATAQAASIKHIEEILVRQFGV